MTNLDPEPSLHYIDASGRPLDVRPWYRYWVLFFVGIAAWLVYAVASTPRIGGFDAGTRDGGAAASALLATAYAVAWIQDVRHRREDRRYWERHNHRNAARILAVGVTGTVTCLLGIVAAMRLGDTYVSGLLVAPGTAALFCLLIGAQVRQRQRQSAE